MHPDQIETMTEGYLSAAFFTDLPEGEVGPGEFDPSPYLGKVPAKVRAKAREDCARFFRENAADLSDYPAKNAGMDLWYSRNGHGCGFFEDDWTDAPIGARLQDAARKLGPRSLVKVRGRYYIE